MIQYKNVIYLKRRTVLYVISQTDWQTAVCPDKIIVILA